MDLIAQLEAEQVATLGKDIPDFKAGDNIRVGYKVTEGSRSRVQNYEGVCIARNNGSGISGSFTVRKISFDFRRCSAKMGWLEFISERFLFTFWQRPPKVLQRICWIPPFFLLFSLSLSPRSSYCTMDNSCLLRIWEPPGIFISRSSRKATEKNGN